MWIVNALVVHLLLLGSIFVIYFRSPVLQGLTPQQPLGLEAPARRLVLIVTDGLRAESFFRDSCNDIPHLRQLLPKGLVGVSHTRVPTESRPGHIALIAGLYEDPSAVTRGWKENPIEFDTLFNRSAKTYAWGANDVLHIFSRLSGASEQRLFIDAYDHELDFSGRDKTFMLDVWVFERVRLLLIRREKELQEEQQVVYFLHLLGLDSAGHVHKPGSPLFLENLYRTERGVWEIYRQFQATFPDNRTAYVLTSDHGMTNAGSHGSGDPMETETPFLLWGAGISKQAPHQGKSFEAGEYGTLPLYELEQAQMAPLMSALLGLPPPMNNFGTLPAGYLNVSQEYEAHAAHSNALQLLEQFQLLLEQHQRGLFAPYLRGFKQLDLQRIADYKRAIVELFQQHDYAAATQLSYATMQAALLGIDYYHGYYRNALLMSTTATFLGWICYLLQLLMQRESVSRSNKSSNSLGRSLLLYVTAGVLVVFLLLQQVPLLTSCYLVLPLLVWLLTMRQRAALSWSQLQALPFAQLLLFVLCAELLVFTFFERRLISLGFLLFACMSHFRAFTVKDLKFGVWLLLVLVLIIFPLLPPSVGYKNTPLLLLGMLLTLARPFLAKSRLSLREKLLACVALTNAVICIYQHSHQIGISLLSQIVSWTYLLYSFAAILLHPAEGLKQRVELIFFNLAALYALFCTSYESLFMLMLASELMLALSAQQSQSPLQIDTHTLHATKQNLQRSFRLAFAILLYTFFSFFGTGNIASVSSFDPNIIRCFLTKFSPFIIMALVILKLVIPVVLNICIIYGVSAFARVYERQIFICLLLICDVMGLNFLFLVRNRGSWLEIGSSISHFVIMEVTTLVLLLLAGVAKLLLGLNTSLMNTVKGK